MGAGGIGWPSSEQFWLEVCAWEECKEPNAPTEASTLASGFFFFLSRAKFCERLKL